MIIVVVRRGEGIYISVLQLILSMVYCNELVKHSIINPTLIENNELSLRVSMQ